MWWWESPTPTSKSSMKIWFSSDPIFPEVASVPRVKDLDTGPPPTPTFRCHSFLIFPLSVRQGNCWFLCISLMSSDFILCTINIISCFPWCFRNKMILPRNIPCVFSQINYIHINLSVNYEKNFPGLLLLWGVKDVSDAVLENTLLPGLGMVRTATVPLALWGGIRGYLRVYFY